MFHKKTKELDQDPYSNYRVLCGIEEEFLIINKEGNLVEAADEVMVRAAELLEKNPKRLKSLQFKIRGLDAEPSPSQIEYVTLPLPPKELEQAVLDGRKLLIDATRQLGAKILAQSLHPIQSDPHPMSGTHINVSIQRKGGFMTVDELKAVNNYFWNYLPELIAISGNSPIFAGNLTNLASNRYANSTVLKPNGFAVIEVPQQTAALVPMHYYGRTRYTLKIGSGESEISKRVITNPQGDRLVDITPRGPLTNIAEDKDDSLVRNRVEIRIFDVQQNYQYLLDLAYLCCASALHALKLQLTGEITPDSYHKRNVENAVFNGIKAKFIKHKNKDITLLNSLSNWTGDIKEYLEMLNIKFTYLPDLPEKKTQEKFNINIKTPTIEKLRQQRKVFAVVKLDKSRIITDKRGRRYSIPRGTKIEGRLSTRYKLTYEEKNDLVTTYLSIDLVNTIVLRGISIPLDERDRVIVAIDETEYMSRRLFGGFGFG
ncbi:MAG: hypothetical protein ACW964_00560 [Candidatus Hodarchaeales archaeon]|jgi:hypothetical protein